MEINRAGKQLRCSSTNFITRNDEGPTIEGYFSVFNSDYEWWPGEKEQVAPGAFAESLGGDVRAPTMSVILCLAEQLRALLRCAKMSAASME